MVAVHLFCHWYLQILICFQYLETKRENLSSGVQISKRSLFNAFIYGTISGQAKLYTNILKKYINFLKQLHHLHRRKDVRAFCATLICVKCYPIAPDLGPPPLVYALRSPGPLDYWACGRFHREVVSNPGGRVDCVEQTRDVRREAGQGRMYTGSSCGTAETPSPNPKPPTCCKSMWPEWCRRDAVCSCKMLGLMFADCLCFQCTISRSMISSSAKISRPSVRL